CGCRACSPARYAGRAAVSLLTPVSRAGRRTPQPSARCSSTAAALPAVSRVANRGGPCARGSGPCRGRSTAAARAGPGGRRRLYLSSRFDVTVQGPQFRPVVLAGFVEGLDLFQLQLGHLLRPGPDDGLARLVGQLRVLECPLEGEAEGLAQHRDDELEGVV